MQAVRVTLAIRAVPNGGNNVGVERPKPRQGDQKATESQPERDKATDSRPKVNQNATK